MSTPSPTEKSVDASFSTTAAAAESRGTLHEPPPPAEGAASAAGSAPSSAPRGARARGGGRPRAIALERRRKSPCRLADAHTGHPCGRRRRGRVARPQDVAHAASLGGLQLGGWRLGHHLANIQLEIIAPTLLVRRGGHVRDRRGRRRGQTLLEFECAAASPARAPIRAPRRATTTSSSRAKHHHERAGAADALGGTATLREFFAGRRAARTWRMRIDAPSNFPRGPRASHQVPGGMVLRSTSYRPLSSLDRLPYKK